MAAWIARRRALANYLEWSDGPKTVSTLPTLFDCNEGREPEALEPATCVTRKSNGTSATNTYECASGKAVIIADVVPHGRYRSCKQIAVSIGRGHVTHFLRRFGRSGWNTDFGLDLASKSPELDALNFQALAPLSVGGAMLGNSGPHGLSAPKPGARGGIN